MPGTFLNNQSNFTKDFNKKLTDDDPLGLKRKAAVLPPSTVAPPQPVTAPQAAKPAPVVQTLDEVLSKTPQPATAPQPATKSMSDILQPSKAPFDISQTELFKKSAEATGKLLGGDIPGVSQAEKIARENLAVAQAAKEKKIREDLTTQGFRDTGKFISEGIVKSENQQQRERQDLERQLIADRATASQQAVGQGLQSSQNLLGMIQGGEAQKAENDVKLAITELQGKISAGEQVTALEHDKMEKALDRAQSLAEQTNDLNAKQKIEDLRAQLAREGILSTEKIAVARIASDESIANLNIGAQESILRLKSELDTDRLMVEQDFTEARDQLAQEHELAVQSENITAQKEIEEMQANLQLVMQEKAQEYENAQRIATQSWQTTERLGEQDFVNAENFLKMEHALAVQNNDIEAQLKIADDRNMLQLKLQTNDMTHDEKMTHLKAQLDEAKADKDVGRQKDIMTFAHTQEMEKVLQEQGFKESMLYVQNELDQALQNNEFENGKVLMQLKHQQEMKIHQDNLAVDQMRIDLQQAGIDMAEQQQAYDFIKNEIAEGRADPGDLRTFLENTVNGIPDDFEFTDPDPNAVQNAISADWVNQQYQYAIVQGDADGDGMLDAGIYEKDAQGNNIFVGLADEHAQDFNNHMNETIYGKDTSPSLGGTDIKGENTGVAGDYYIDDNTGEVEVGGVAGRVMDKFGKKIEFEGMAMYKVGADGSPVKLTPNEMAIALRNANNANNTNNETYNTLLNKSPEANIRVDSPTSNTLAGVPAEGSIIKVGDRIMVITQGEYNSKEGRNHQAFEIMDISTGTKRTFTGKRAGGNSVSGLNDWAGGLSG